MPWLRGGDNAATHPLVMALATVRGSDERTTDEVFGFVMRCAMQSAGHLTDYRVDLGTALLLAGSKNRAERVLRQAVEAGLMTVSGRGRARCWQIVDDPEFLHMQRRDEVERNRKRRADKGNPNLIVPVRVRDGDQCRYCSVVVYFGQRVGPRAGTYDHRNDIDTEPTTIDTLVVACSTCNGRRLNDRAADQRVPLQPAPLHPYYSAKTAVFLAKHGVLVESSPEPASSGPTRDPDPVRTPRTPTRPPARPGRRPDTAHDPARPEATASDTAPSTRPGDPAPDPAPSTTWDSSPPDPPPTWASSPPPSDLQNSAAFGRNEVCGPGRDGTGRAGAGVQPSVPAARDAPTPPDEPARRRRARRSRK
ncbi:hypothetical protein PZ938_03025 [Luteipulveratus sp. YIM 133132]|uniref:hypothetical protein n=1 Tax=Luteipulveratus flavus TaxID=3031728 RepID=UPI0023B060E8|nr:hypothetical protein [Luteipulveratus sp. YIM 133132]MDE9364565.1 hypothetical protein [Luteipulveratus sp. YIM 133132]